MKELIRQLKIEEGLRLRVYLCTGGARTIGYGHNLAASMAFPPNGKPLGRKIPDTITPAQAEELLIADIIKASSHLAIMWPKSRHLDNARLDACVAMVFQLGITGFMRFKRMLAALEAGNFFLAEEEALNSLWAKQTPARALRVAKQLRTGVYY